MNFADRIAWAINRTKRKNRLSWPKIAKILGTNKDTIATYAKSKGDKIIAPVLIGLASEFKYSSVWLLRGEGEPFSGARQQFPEVCGPADPHEVRQETVKYQTEDAVPHMLDKPEGAVEDKYGLWGDTRRHDKEGVPFDVSLFKPEGGFDPYGDAQEGLREIFESRDPVLIPAIESNIRAFRLSVRRERQVAQQALEIEKLKEECVELKDRIAALEDKHKPEDPHGHGRELKRSTAT